MKKTYKPAPGWRGSTGFKAYAMKRGLDPVVAGKLTNALNATGFFEEAIDKHWRSDVD